MFLLPIIVGSAAAVWISKFTSFGRGWWLNFSQLPVVAGFLGSLWGYFVGCGIVWATRILGTLGFGKEAMGMGDVPLMGAAGVAAERFGASEIIDPRPYVVGEIAETFKKYPNIGTLLPAMGYSDEQIKDMETTINATPCDAVVIGTPIDLRRICSIEKRSTRVMYDL